MAEKVFTSEQRAVKYRTNMGDCPECGSSAGLEDLKCMFGFVITYRKMKCNACGKIFRMQYFLESMAAYDKDDNEL